MIYVDGKTKIYKLPKESESAVHKLNEFQNSEKIEAILTSSQSSDAYVYLYEKAKDKTPEDIIKNYKEYLINYGDGDKYWFIISERVKRLKVSLPLLTTYLHLSSVFYI